MKAGACVEVGTSGTWLHTTEAEAIAQAQRNLGQWPTKQYLVGELPTVYQRTLGPITASPSNPTPKEFPQ